MSRFSHHNQSHECSAARQWICMWGISCGLCNIIDPRGRSNTYSITPFPSTVVSHQPRVVHEIRKKVYCKCRAPDNGKPMIRCCACRQCFHPECIGVGTRTDKWKCPTCTEKHFDSCACFNDFSCIVLLIHVSIHNY